MNYYDYGYEAVESSTSLLGGLFASLGIMMLISSAVGIFMLVAMWKLFKKAGKNGWECLIPIYNIIVLLEITELPTWYIALFFVPFANIYAMFKIYIELAHKFGQSTGFGVAMVFFAIICVPILAFGDAQYIGKGMANDDNVGVMPNNNPNIYSGMPAQNVAPVAPVAPVSPVGSTVPVTPVAPVAEQQIAPQPQFITQQPVAPEPAPQPQVQNFNIFDNPSSQPVQPQVNVFENQVVQPQSAPQPVEAQVAPTITDIPTPGVEQSKFCPNCGNKTPMSADTCFMCGHKF